MSYTRDPYASEFNGVPAGNIGLAAAPLAPARSCAVPAGTTTDKNCATQQACPTIADLMCITNVAGVPFEYVEKTGPDRGTGMIGVLKRIPNRQQKFRPRFIAALERFVVNMNRFGMPIDAILTLGSLYCRCIMDTNKLSRHSYGEAMDIVGVRWRRPADVPSRVPETIIHNHPIDPDERVNVLRISACLRLAFPLVLDYHFNAAHKDHFHCDLASGRRVHGPALYKPVQEMLMVALGRSIPITGRLDAATRLALAEVAGVPPGSLQGDPLDAALDQLFARIASRARAGSTPMPPPSVAPVPPPRVTPVPARSLRPSAGDIALVHAAFARGTTELKDLANIVFHARHPELGGRSIRPGERQLAHEWIDIRDRIVRPLLPVRAPKNAPRAVPNNTSHAAPARAPASSPAASLPAGTFGAVVARLPGQPAFTYRFTPEDALWTARMIHGEAGGRDDADNRAVIWAMINRYAFFTHRNYPTFHQFVRAYSTPLQPVLKSWQAAQRHAHKPDFVRIGGTYPPPAPAGLPKGLLRSHQELQAMPWSRLGAGARSLVENVLRGGVPNPVGNASEFASTRILFNQKHKRVPTDAEWRAFTTQFKRDRSFVWIGDVPGIDQKRNAFFTRSLRINPRDPSSPRYADLPAGTVQVVAGAPATSP